MLAIAVFLMVAGLLSLLFQGAGLVRDQKSLQLESPTASADLSEPPWITSALAASILIVGIVMLTFS